MLFTWDETRPSDLLVPHSFLFYLLSYWTSQPIICIHPTFPSSAFHPLNQLTLCLLSPLLKILVGLFLLLDLLPVGSNLSLLLLMFLSSLWTRSNHLSLFAFITGCQHY